MATNYDINYNDKRFTQVEADKKVALNEVDTTYGDMISKSDKYFEDLIDQSKDWADKQADLQNQKTNLAIKEINQQKAQAKKDYTKEQSGAYVDWQKQSNQYGANAEQMAAQGLTNTGFSESSQVSMYNTYQNRVATAREAFVLAKQNYDNAIAEARLQNSSILAEIAAEAYQKQLELSLQGFQYKNQLITEMSDKKLAVEESYYQRYQDVLKQINTENALAEEVRQYNASLDEEKRQYNSTLALQQAELAEQKRQFNILHPQTSGGNAAIKKTSGGSSRKGVVKSTKLSATHNGGVAKDGATAQATLKDDSSGGNTKKLTYSDVAATAAQLRKKGASKQEINQYLNTVVQSKNYKPTTSASQDLFELTSGYVGHSGR